MNWGKLIGTLVLAVIIMSAAVLYYVHNIFFTIPTDFEPTDFVITPGESLVAITTNLEQANIVNSAFALRVLFSINGNSTTVKAGTFIFDTPMLPQEVAETLVAGQFDTELVEVTFLEGERASAFGLEAADTLDSFDVAQWNELTQDYEGALFPDTYFIPPTYTASDLFTLMRTQQDKVLTDLQPQLTVNSLTQEEVLILASILEREANTAESMRMVAGIFLNRMEIGMPLQADATIAYVLETPLGELPPGQLAAELREVESPYNTYKNQGLPPTPIGNPGRIAIEAVLNPIPSDYLYYITGTDGQFYYATTYDQHRIHIERYLR